MKKYLFIVVPAFMLSVILPNETNAQAVFGVKAGPLFSNMTTRIDGSKFNNQMIIGLTGGVYARLPLSSEFYVQPALLYKGKGNTQEMQGYKVKTKLNYLTLPVDFLFKLEMPSAEGVWFLGLGPYFAYGVSGKVTGGPDSWNVNGDPFKDISGSINRFDAGADILVVYEMASGLNFGLNAELGVLNLADHGDRKNSVRNTSFGLTLGYTFGKN